MAIAHRQWEAERISRRRRLPVFAWRRSAMFTAGVGLLTLPPILLAALRIPSGSVFPGYLVIARDAYVYQSMWRAGWHGAWLFHPAYTAETLPGILLYPWYLWPAHLVGWASGPWLYHAARLLAAAALLALVTIAGWALLRHQPRAAAFVVPAALAQLPYLGYLLWVWATTPDALRVVRTSLDVGDPFGFLVLSHLVASGLILIALANRRLRGDLVLPALWIVGMTVFMFVPGISGTLGRSFMASSVPFGLCAAPGLLVVLRRVRAVRCRRRA